MKLRNTCSCFALFLVVLASVGISRARAGVIRDSTQLEHWEELTVPLGHLYGSFNKANAPVYLTGNGQKLSRIGLIWGHAGTGGQPNQGDIETLEWRFMLFNGTADFASDPHGEARPQGMFHLFEEPTNGSWQTILGTTGGYNMRYAEFDVEFLNLTLTQGTEFLASVQPRLVQGGGIGATFIGFANGGSGSQHDWFKSNVMGPGTLHDLGAPYDYAAWKVTTVPACLPDFDGDGFVTGADFDLFVQAFEAGEMTADFDGDGFITGLDFDLYVQAFEDGC